MKKPQINNLTNEQIKDVIIGLITTDTFNQTGFNGIQYDTKDGHSIVLAVFDGSMYSIAPNDMIQKIADQEMPVSSHILH